jgi:hypothetical protein
MSLRVGSLLLITGLALALLLGSLFVVVGLMVMVCGGFVLAAGMESLLAEEPVDGGVTAKPIDAHRLDVDAGPRDIAA